MSWFVGKLCLVMVELFGNSAQNGSFRICNPEMLPGFYPPNQQLALSRVGIFLSEAPRENQPKTIVTT